MTQSFLNLLVEGVELFEKLLDAVADEQTDDSDEGNEDKIDRARIELETLSGTINDIVP